MFQRLFRFFGYIPESDYIKLKIESELNNLTEENKIYKQNLDFADSVIKRWNEFRQTMNLLHDEIINNNPSYYEENSSVIFHIFLQDSYFRRLYKLRYGADFFETAEDIKTEFINKNNNAHVLQKVFWEINKNYQSLVFDDHFIKDWDKYIRS